MRAVLKRMLMPVVFLAMSGVLIYDHLPARVEPGRRPTIDGVALGRSYAPVLLTTYAEAWEEAASAIEAGKTVSEAQAALQETWKQARVKAFQENVLPVFQFVLPEGTEPIDPVRRTETTELWRSFARGLKDGR